MLASTLTLPAVKADRNEIRPSIKVDQVVGADPEGDVGAAVGRGLGRLGDAAMLDHRVPGGVQVGDVADQDLAARDGRAHVGLVAVEARHQRGQLPLDLGLGRHSALLARYRLSGSTTSGWSPTWVR